MDSKVIHGDCLEVLKTISSNSVDSIVTDPPYGISFLGKKWDYDVPSIEVWKECVRVLKPGGYLLAFAGTRTQHRMAVNIEDAGFEIRDIIAWVYGSGFPKSTNISKAIDKAAGAERQVIGKYQRPDGSGERTEVPSGTSVFGVGGDQYITAPATEEAKKWNGWGTALKPAMEMITVARKPISVSTVTQNVLVYGTGALNIEDSRVHTDEGKIGRWPANFIHDGSEEVTNLFPHTQSGGPAKSRSADDRFWKGKRQQPNNPETYNGGDSGSAARFFYSAKTSKAERNTGVENNNHPTVKPIKLMEYLIRLVTPPDGIVLDPFAGSGTTGIAAKRLGFQSILIEREQEYVELAEHRIAAN